MHFYYLDETGCTGKDLDNKEQPIFVLGGISVRDEGWIKTTTEFEKIISNFFDGNVPNNFEVHSHEMFNLKGHFKDKTRDEVSKLIHRILDLIIERGHSVHFIGIDKKKMKQAMKDDVYSHPACNIDNPYLLSFNYLARYIEKHVKEKLGSSARGMIILDVKDNYQSDIDSIVNYHRFKCAKTHRLKRLVEFTYPSDSKRHPMIQLSDVVLYAIRKFLEIDEGYKDSIPDEAKNFYAQCYEKIVSRSSWTNIIETSNKDEKSMLLLLNKSVSKHKRNWKSIYKF